ncbi:hypothetical protein CA13_61400 [Planctomycetes bacterium CA13]|uniref:Uncharacterized protein n=1 Tax=Novipirellula herctigrandis TaxID=2527986 RepID=A0A5C5ZBZ2_9BACT|nr:hypothetical protein CA13_61400 [Planctomycetes bacterium CA13]
MPKTVRGFLDPYYTKRNHWGLDNKLIVPMDRPPDMDVAIEATEHLGGLL